MQKSVLNKQGKFGVKILWRYTDMVIFVLRCFILTHPVYECTRKSYRDTTKKDSAWAEVAVEMGEGVTGMSSLIFCSIVTCT